ncbi:hypothetical protein H2203_001702 [Taxawa tesnikishii (nom. ined.)]|nr:hypothetical protein H2203_001702 [Dothideales sp. JES 119]
MPPSDQHRGPKHLRSGSPADASSSRATNSTDHGSGTAQVLPLGSAYDSEYHTGEDTTVSDDSAVDDDEDAAPTVPPASTIPPTATPPLAPIPDPDRPGSACCLRTGRRDSTTDAQESTGFPALPGGVVSFLPPAGTQTVPQIQPGPPPLSPPQLIPSLLQFTQEQMQAFHTQQMERAVEAHVQD